MCEYRQKPDAAEGKVTVTTIEAGVPTNNGNGVTARQPDIIKGKVTFEKALQLTKFGKFNYFLIFVSGLILANVLLETLAISFVLPVSQCDLHWTINERGALSGIGFVGIITTSHLWGFLADTTGRRKIMRPTLLLGFAFTVVSSFTNHFWSLIILRYLNGFCISGGSATVYAYLGEFHTAKTRSSAIMGAAFIFGIGSILLPAVAWLVINQDWQFAIPLIGIVYKPWRLFMVVCAIPGLICGLCLFKIPESPKFLLTQGKCDATLEILTKIYNWNTGKPKEEYPVLQVLEELDLTQKPPIPIVKSSPVLSLFKSMWAQTQPLFNREYLRTTILICVVQFWIFTTSNGMYMWFPEILNSVSEYINAHPDNKTYICEIIHRKQELIFENANSGACREKLEISTFEKSLVLEICYAVGFALLGYIIRYIEKYIILLFVLAACGVCGILTVYVHIPLWSIYMYLILLLCGLAVSVLSALTVDLYPTRQRAMAVCISLMMGRLGSVVGAYVGGILISSYCESAFLAAGISLIFAGFLGIFIPRPAKSKMEESRRHSLVSLTGN